MIRRYNRDDIHSIVELELNTLGTTLGEAMLTQELENSMSYYYVYEENERILGYISLSFDGYIGEILNFAVWKEYQGRGIGKRLISYALDELYQRNAESFILEVRESNVKAIALYSKLGFKEISKRKNYYSNGENAIAMQKLMVLHKDMYDAYYQAFSKYEYHDSYIKVFDDKHPRKYFHNFYIMRKTDYRAMEDIRKNSKGFVQFHLDSPYTGEYDYPEVEELGYYHSSIFNLSLFEDSGARVEKLNEMNKDLFHALMYVDSLPYGEQYAKDNSNRLIEVAFENSNMDWYIVYDDTTMVGALSVYQYQDAICIEDFFVLDRYQKKGYGSSLFNFVIEEAKKKNIHDVFLTVDVEDSVKNMYERMGFTLVGKLYIVREVF